MWKGLFPGVPGVGWLLSGPDTLWILLLLSLQMCVPDIFSKSNLTLLFPLRSRHHPPSPPPPPQLQAWEKLWTLLTTTVSLSRRQCLGGVGNLCAPGTPPTAWLAQGGGRCGNDTEGEPSLGLPL